MVYKLRPGDAFRVELGGKYRPLDYRVIYVNECRAYVEPLTRHRDILEDSAGGRVNIAPNTECEIIDEELEMIMGTTPSTTVTKTGSAKAKRISGDRKFESKKQERPVREGTIRADLLAALESGKTDINKLMKEFGMARSLLIAHVHEMWKCHGYGYSVVGDVVKISKPVGGVMKATAAPAKKAKKVKAKTKPVIDPLADEDEDPLA